MAPNRTEPTAAKLTSPPPLDAEGRFEPEPPGPLYCSQHLLGYWSSRWEGSICGDPKVRQSCHQG
eukprot:scaffold422366_cov71-Attheya_sp.AAC.1